MPGQGTARRQVLGILVGAGLFFAVLLSLAGIAVATGVITRDPTGRPDLGPWLAWPFLPPSCFSPHSSRRWQF